eukprot:6607642-Lingulodinium_polyedra.AAC.1
MAAAPGRAAAWPQPGGPGAARGTDASQEPRDGPSAGLDSLAIQRTCSTQPLASRSAQSLRETPRSPGEEVLPLSEARATVIESPRTRTRRPTLREARRRWR